MDFLLLFPAAFFLTNLLEFPFYYFFIQKNLKKKLSVLIAINLFTLPLLWLLLPFFFHNYLFVLFVAEVTITVIEAGLIKTLLEETSRRALAVSSAANFVSFILGFVLF